MLTAFEVGKAFPGPVPPREGAHMELWEGLVVLIQMPGLRQNELKAFKKGFKRYGYLESDTPVPIAVWVFDFPDPHGPIDTVFNARPVKKEYLDSYLDTDEGIKNAVHFFLLDGQTLKAQKLVGLHPEAVELFHGTIRKQLATEYTRADYDRYLIGLFQSSTQELFHIGKVFEV